MPPTHPPASPLRLEITSEAEWKIRCGHPWLFESSIVKQSRTGESGDLAVVYDRKNKFLCLGFWDPESPLRLRVLLRNRPAKIDASWWKNHLQSTLAKRKDLFPHPEQTNGYRLINGDSEHWPGLILDQYGSTLVLKLYSSFWFPLLPQFLAHLSECHHFSHLLLRLSRNLHNKGQTFHPTYHDGALLLSRPQEPSPPELPIPESVEFCENGLRFISDVQKGQKTGFFLDQRDNRAWVETQTHGHRVLNLFSYTGAFSLYAARGGAETAQNIDISAFATEGCNRHFQLNQDQPNIRRCHHTTLQADVFEYLQGQTQHTSPSFIILDPPALAKRASDRPQAIEAYRFLIRKCLQKLPPHGILLATSCSSQVTEDEFLSLARSEASRESTRNRSFAELRTFGLPPDHPATYPEARYLKGLAWKHQTT